MSDRRASEADCAEHAEPLDIAPLEAQQLLRKRDDVLLLDCRTHEEVEVASIDGAIVLPMQEIAERVNELTPHRKTTVLVICHAGIRSRRVALWLREQGFADARSIAGGIDRWSCEIDPTIPRY